MILPRQHGPQALLDLEDAGPAILQEPFPGTTTPLWPQVRYPLAVLLQGLDFGVSAPPLRSAPVRPLGAVTALARAVTPSRWDARGMRGRRDILFLVGGTTVVPTAAGLRNWLIADLAEAFPNRTAVLQWQPLSLRRGGPDFAATASLDPMLTRVSAAARLRPAPTGSQRRDVEQLLAGFARDVDPRLTPALLTPLTADLLARERRRPLLERAFDRILDRLQPRIVVMEDAGYGYWSPLIARMKDRGVRVAEMQHGWIGPSHAAYNFGAAMSRGTLAEYIPDELLTFGELWTEGVRFPGPVAPIGKPHLEAEAARAARLEERPREVLFVSATGDEDATSDLLLALAAELGDGWTVRLRPHPIERASVAARYPRLIGAAGIDLDLTEDVAVSLGRARGVIGGQSTAFFEAVAMGCQVFPMQNALTPFYVGDLFGETVAGPADAARIAGTLRAGRAPSAELTTGLWRPRAVENYRAWIGDRL